MKFFRLDNRHRRDGSKNYSRVSKSMKVDNEAQSHFCLILHVKKTHQVTGSISVDFRTVRYSKVDCSYFEKESIMRRFESKIKYVKILEITQDVLNFKNCIRLKIELLALLSY